MKPATKPPMKPFRYIAYVLAAFVIIFGIQNAKPVELSFLFWVFEGSLGLLLLLAFLLGLLAGLLLIIPRLLFKKGPQG